MTETSTVTFLQQAQKAKKATFKKALLEWGLQVGKSGKSINLIKSHFNKRCESKSFIEDTDVRRFSMRGVLSPGK